MKLTLLEKIYFKSCITDLLESERVQEMRQYIQHGSTTTYSHCMTVAYYSYWLCLRLRLKVDISSVIRGALLHDFYLYDWHCPDNSHRLHGFCHPSKSLANARLYFELTPLEEDIIEKHMWPLTVTKLPKYKEAFVVCFMDKVCSTAETIHLNTRKHSF